jgi:lysyl oxidase
VRRGRLLISAGLTVPVAIAVSLLVGTSRGGETIDLVPNLDQAAPGELAGRTGGTLAKPQFFLGFESAAENVGEGPLVVIGNRPNVGVSRMRIVQEIRRTDGSTRTIPAPASLRYVRSPDHSHWHFLGFMRYELRTAEGRRVRRDRKTGFCLGDRYRLGLKPAHAEASPRFADECGKGKPGLLSMREGISVGYGDNYKANLEGQEFDVTELPAGRYVLVHRVNPQRLLRESDYGNNAASMALALSWPRGRRLPPRIDVIARCPATATCP